MTAIRQQWETQILPNVGSAMAEGRLFVEESAPSSTITDSRHIKTRTMSSTLFILVDLISQFSLFQFPRFYMSYFGFKFSPKCIFLILSSKSGWRMFFEEKKTVLCKSLTQFLFHLFTLNLKTHFFDLAHTETGSELHFLLWKTKEFYI